MRRGGMVTRVTAGFVPLVRGISYEDQGELRNSGRESFLKGLWISKSSTKARQEA